ncbi:SpaH/EbpB family LPXTG-anchored major pilin [Alloscardovia criceti]|uniref:SpaH/EbpB family LPXTG-anchored major pilin n=1 Tax=Alloscardovia criceti TaxID=356828 RepID=UPI00037063BA|nr:SpaH/EbpB family LPXTG-anchored major pilin [Alloscardovia criceti]
MLRNKIRGIRAILAFLIACALGVATFAVAPLASGAEGNIDIDESRTGSLTVHKYEKNSAIWANQTNDGTEITNIPEGANPLTGVQFTVYQVEGLDLKDSASWTGLDSATGDLTTAKATINGKEYTLTQKAQQTTDSKGTAAFTELPVGLYYVVESNIGNNEITEKAQPFFVTIPFAQANKTWNYDVHAYPKNVLNTPGEKIADTSETHKVGDIITWDLKLVAPTSDNGITALGVVDPLDTSLALAPTAAGDVKTAVEVLVNPTKTDGVYTGGTALDASAYTVEPLTALTDGRIPVKVALVAGSDGKITSVNAGDVVVVKIRTTVTTVPNNGEITNGFFPIVNEYDPFSENPTDPGEPPVTTEDTPKFGDYAFKKVDDTTDANALDGAVFELQDTNGNPVLDGEGNTITATSDENGIVHFSDIFLGKSRKGDTTLTKEFKIKETTAPAGFKLLENAVTVTFKQGKVDTSDVANLGANIVNTKSNMPNLPLTGAAGKVLMTLAGVAIIAIAVALLMVQRARQSSKG